MVTSQMRIQEKAIWKKFVFGFNSIKNQKLNFFQKEFREYVSLGEGSKMSA